jgi:hypothetical protein
MKKVSRVEQCLLNRILFIGNEVPEFFTTDKRPKFIILGVPQDFINEVAPCTCDGIKSVCSKCK